MNKPAWMIADETATNAKRERAGTRTKAKVFAVNVRNLAISDQEADARREQAFLDFSEGESFYM